MTPWGAGGDNRPDGKREESPRWAHVMDGRRLFEIVVAVVGMAALVGTFVWLAWFLGSFGDPR